LRQTGDDRLILLDHYKRIFSAQMGLPPFRITPDALRCWLAYDFPGNVRELRNIVIRLLVRYAGQTVGREELEAEQEADVVTTTTDVAATPALPAPGAVRDIAPSGVDLPAVLRRVERDYIAAALQQSRGNMSQAARLLGINRSTLYNRLETLARHGEDFGTASLQDTQ
jgi:DNA-binding NtrC family response regulator